jgi:hypothetical protein
VGKPAIREGSDQWCPDLENPTDGSDLTDYASLVGQA